MSRKPKTLVAKLPKLFLGKHTFVINNFSQIEAKHSTETVIIHGLSWKLLICPFGNGDADYLAIYLVGIVHEVHFTIEIVDQDNPENSAQRASCGQFSPCSQKWGFIQFMKLRHLHDQNSGYLKDDKLVVNVEMAQTDHHITVRIVTDADLRKPSKLGCDLFNFQTVTTFKLIVIAELTKSAETQLGIPEAHQKFWMWDGKCFSYVHDVAKQLDEHKGWDLIFFLDNCPDWSWKGESMIFFKHYDPFSNCLSYAGRIVQRIVPFKAADLMPYMNRLIGQPLNTPLLVFLEEEPPFKELMHLHPNTPIKLFGKATSGAVFVFQTIPTANDPKFTTAPDYYRGIINAVPKSIKLK